mgnify:FL=1
MLNIGILATVLSPYLSVVPPLIMAFLIYKKKIPINLNPINVGLFLLFIWSIISGIANKSILSALASFLLLLYISLNIYLQDYLKNQETIDRFLHKVWTCSFMAGILGLIEKLASYFVDMTWTSDLYFKGPYKPTVENYRIYSTFGNPNIAGAWFAAMVLLAFYLYGRKKEGKKGWYLLSMGVFALALIATGSRGATVGLLLGILIYGLCNKNKVARITLIAIFVAVLAFALLSPEINHPAKSRNIIWEKSMHLFLDKPITGWGTFGIWQNIKKTHAHNIWISMLALYGIVGLTLYLWIKSYIIRLLFLLGKNDNPAFPLLASIQGMIVGHGIVDFIIMAPQGGILFFVCSTIILNLAKQYQTQTYPEFVFKEEGYIK